MQPFEKEVIERLTRVEDKVDVLQKHKDSSSDSSTSLKNFTVSGIISAVVAWGLTHGVNPFS